MKMLAFSVSQETIKLELQILGCELQKESRVGSEAINQEKKSRT
jgi:hypothetical protein